MLGRDTLERLRQIADSNHRSMAAQIRLWVDLELIAREHARLLTIQAATEPATASTHPTNHPAATAG